MPPKSPGAQQTILLAYKLLSPQSDPEMDAFSTTSSSAVAHAQSRRAEHGGQVVSEEPGHAVRSERRCRLYQEYVGHDNNRDGYMNNMIESQVITRTELEYYPR